MDNYGPFGAVSDKVEPLGYLPHYLQIAADLGPRARVCEVGVWEGTSLRLWTALFPYGEITGVDTLENAKWPSGTRKVVMRQDDPALAAVLGGPFDLVVDDASHEYELSERTFSLLWPLVAPGGYYVLEDWFVGLDEHIARTGMGDTGMLWLAQSFLELLSSPDSEVDAVTYHFGMAIIHKRRPREPTQAVGPGVHAGVPRGQVPAADGDAAAAGGGGAGAR